MMTLVMTVVMMSRKSTRKPRMVVPVMVAVDSEGSNVHVNGPEEWRKKIQNIDFKYLE